MTPRSTDPTPTTRPTAEIIAFPAGGRNAYRPGRDAHEATAALDAAAQTNVPMIRGCWYHDDAINEVDAAKSTH